MHLQNVTFFQSSRCRTHVCIVPFLENANATVLETAKTQQKCCVFPKSLSCKPKHLTHLCHVWFPATMWLLDCCVPCVPVFKHYFWTQIQYILPFVISPNDSLIRKRWRENYRNTSDRTSGRTSSSSKWPIIWSLLSSFHLYWSSNQLTTSYVSFFRPCLPSAACQTAEVSRWFGRLPSFSYLVWTSFWVACIIIPDWTIQSRLFNFSFNRQGWIMSNSRVGQKIHNLRVFFTIFTDSFVNSSDCNQNHQKWLILWSHSDREFAK